MNAIPPSSSSQRRGWAIASLCLGIVGLVSVGILTGIPAIFAGLRAKRQAKEQPNRYGGKKLATAGIVLGALSPITTLLAVLFVWTIGKEVKRQVSGGQCVGNLMAVGRALQVHAIDHGTYPDSLLALRGPLKRPDRLWCAGDTNHTVSTNWNSMSADNVTFELLQPGGTEADNQGRAVLRCPIHRSEWWGDDSVHLANGRVIRAQ